MISPLEISQIKLTEIQQEAVKWGEGTLLVLAGPGSGKTQVLTCRIARLLDSSRDQHFRVLALTFTNKAADEMKTRVANFVPGLEDRANIGTFHSFCAQILRQHGVHLGINPDFAIYSDDNDRHAVLVDALRRAQSGGQSVRPDDIRFLGVIDRLKSRLIEPDNALTALARFDEREEIVIAYRAYEEELRRINALDFNSLIFDAFRLITTFPAIAARYRQSHPYWLIDEFQDTNTAQYKLIVALAGSAFRNIFVVADDDQIIYGWNGASYRQILAFLNDFAAQSIQLPTNYRCPPAIVEAANRLVAYNGHRTEGKRPLIAGKTESKYPVPEHMQVRSFSTDSDEAREVAREIANRDHSTWGRTAILSRTRALLEPVQAALVALNVPAVIAQRRDDFLSAEFRWLVSCLKQVVRPLDRRNFELLVESFNRMTGTSIAADQIITDSEATGASFLTTWLAVANASDLTARDMRIVRSITELGLNPTRSKSVVEAIVSEFSTTEVEKDVDLAEDLNAWRELTKDSSSHIGKNAPLDRFLQELQLRSKEPSPKSDSVTLMTIHAAKGREFDFVYLIGLAEEIMPSYQSKQKGDQSLEMEEERRNCFVAITRARECLVLSYAAKYHGWPKKPSRFLREMQFVA